MLNAGIAKAMNEQINAELYSAYLYLSMAAWFDAQQLPGFGHWFKVQAQEEMTHGLRFYSYVNDRGAQVTLAAIAAPPTRWESPLAAMEAVLVHEQKVTGMINKLVTLARKESDYASENLLQWFVKEQVEEESGVEAVIGKLKLATQAQGGLFLLDKDMAARVFVMPLDLTI
jgi:ferritin